MPKPASGETLAAGGGLTEAGAIADLAVAAAGAPQVITTAAGRELLILPNGFRHEDVTEKDAIAAKLPDHVRQAVTLQTLDSLVDYVNAFRGIDTRLFADISQNRIKALLDYHSSAAGDPGVPLPRHVDHAATLSLPYSEEWKIWTGVDKKWMEQLEFARFLEENGGDVAAPAGADLLEACRDLQAVRKVNFKKAVRTATDNESFEYSDDTEARTSGGIELPTKFLLSIPVYFGGQNVSLYAFLRWKLDDGKLSLGFALNRAEHVRQAVFKDVVMDAATRTACPAVFGLVS